MKKVLYYVKEHIEMVLIICIIALSLSVFFIYDYQVTHMKETCEEAIVKLNESKIETAKEEIRTKTKNGYVFYINGEKVDLDVEKYLKTFPMELLCMLMTQKKKSISVPKNKLF